MRVPGNPRYQLLLLNSSLNYTLKVKMLQYYMEYRKIVVNKLFQGKTRDADIESGRVVREWGGEGAMN